MGEQISTNDINYQWTGLMFAHEVGHQLGMMHDFEGFRGNKCPSSGEYDALVMSYGWNQKNDVWSSCSNGDFAKYITGSGQCQGGRFCTQAGLEDYAVDCCDLNDGCSTWKNKYSSWFTQRCTGSMKDEKPSQVSPLTMGEACQKSCGLCGGTTPATKPCVNTPPGNCNRWNCAAWAKSPGCDAQFFNFPTWCTTNAQGQVKDFCQTACKVTCG